jgi:HlyD family secretion protein
MAAVERGTVTASVRATGTLNPVTTVLVGSQLSGQVVEILADYNSPVKAGQVVARLNSEQIKSRRDAALADLAQAKADRGMRQAQLEKARAVLQRAQATTLDLRAQRDRAKAELAEAERNLDRQTELTSRAVGTQNALDQAKTQSEVQRAALASAEAQIASNEAEIVGLKADIALAEAQLRSADALIQQREAKLKDIEIDLARTAIKSPVDGVVVKREVELGQTVAASLSAPTLFTIAQDLREIDIHANIDEADVGRLKEGQTASFTVNAYPNRSFNGAVRMVRLGAQTVSNVVTYTAVIGVDNEDLALLPGMTANLQIVTDERYDVLRVPNAALRFRPAPGAVSTVMPVVDRDVFPELQGRGRSLQDFRERFMAEVEPTKEQLAAIDAVIAEARAAFRSAEPGQDRRESFRRLRQELRTRIAGALDPERRARFLALSEGRRMQSARDRVDPGTPGRVHVLDREGRPVPTSLRLGVTDGSFTEVIAGDVTDGTHVIVGGGPRGQMAADGESSGERPRRPRGPRLF